MLSENGSNITSQIYVNVPERDFSKWLREESRNTRLRIRCDFVIASLPYLTVVVILLLTSIVYRQALIGLAPTLVIWLLRNPKNRGE